MQPRTAVIKTTTLKISKLDKMITEDPGILVISSNEYIRWKLKLCNIHSLPLRLFSPHKKYPRFEKEMSEKYLKLTQNAAKTIDYADLFQNHLCWETQKSFYLLGAIDNLRLRRNIAKIFFEPFQYPKKRYAKSLNGLFMEYFRQKGANVEIF